MMGGMAEIRIDPSSPDDRERIEYVCAGWAHDTVQEMLRASPEMSGRDVLEALQAELTARAEKLSQ